MEIYIDADFARLIVDRRFTSRYCMFLGGNLVTWRCKKQNVVAQSSSKVEFRGMAHDIYEELWMKIILDDLKVKYEGPIKLFYDNNSTISIAHNQVQHDRTKHIEIDRHIIKEKLNSGLVVTSHVPTELQVVDVFTKGLPIARFQELNGNFCEQLPGFESDAFTNHVYKLKKVLYGLKKAPRAWYEKLSLFFMSNGFLRGKIDTTLFCKNYDSYFIIVQIYVNDIIFCAIYDTLCEEFLR
ncbi:Copia protein, partial [Mucuna pruriens]